MCAVLFCAFFAPGRRVGNAGGGPKERRGASDLSRTVARWIADALAVPDLSRPAIDPGAERFYLAALAFGHRLAIEGRPIAHGLRDRAARIVTARAMANVDPPDDSSAGNPLALLEAAMRNLGIAGYMDG